MSFFSFSAWLPLPLWKLLLDGVFAAVMWLLILRFTLLILVAPTSPVPVIRQILAAGRAVISATRFIIPNKLNERAHELYLAGLVLLLRYYVLPLMAGYDIKSLNALPAEARLFQLYTALFSLF